MEETASRERAVELLQELGLKQYEARTFVALARRDRGTAKQISETSEVPRTRVYDAVRVLESKGLVETQHANPQVFRAVPVAEAVETLRTTYEERAASLREALTDLDPPEEEASEDVTHEVWALSGEQAIARRTERAVEEADREVLVVVGSDDVLTDRLVDRLADAEEDDVDVIVGTTSADRAAVVTERLPDVETFVSGLDWLTQSPLPGDDTEISRLLLIDRETILVSTANGDGSGDEHGVFGRGFDNGLVAVVRRILATGLVAGDDPAADD